MSVQGENTQTELNQEQKKSAPVFVKPLIVATVFFVVLILCLVALFSNNTRSRKVPEGAVLVCENKEQGIYVYGISDYETRKMHLQVHYDGNIIDLDGGFNGALNGQASVFLSDLDNDGTKEILLHVPREGSREENICLEVFYICYYTREGWRVADTTELWYKVEQMVGVRQEDDILEFYCDGSRFLYRMMAKYGLTGELDYYNYVSVDSVGMKAEVIPAFLTDSDSAIYPLKIECSLEYGSGRIKPVFLGFMKNEKHDYLMKEFVEEEEIEEMTNTESSLYEEIYRNVREPKYDEITLGMVREVFAESEFLNINRSDLEVNYEGFLVNKDTNYAELNEYLEQKTGIGLNKGYKNRKNKQLEYDCYHPGYFEYQIGLGFRNFNTGSDEKLAFIDLTYSGTIRGLKRGDDITRVAGLYGKPQRIDPYGEWCVQMIYAGEGGVVRITTDKSGHFVDEIYIDYAYEGYVYEEPVLSDWQVAFLHVLRECQDDVKMNSSGNQNRYETGKYLLCDVTLDGTPELILYKAMISPDNKTNLEVYTCENGEAKKLGDVRTGWMDFYTDGKGLIVSSVSSGDPKTNTNIENYDRIVYSPVKQEFVIQNIYSKPLRYVDVEKVAPGAVKLPKLPIDYVLAVSEYGTKSDTATKKKGDIKLLYDFISQKNGTVYGIDATRGDQVGEMPFVDFVCLMGSRHFGLMEPIKYTDVDINKDGQAERIVILEKGMIILNYQDDEVYAYYMTEAHAPDLETYYETTDGKGRAFWIYSFNGENHYDRFYFNRTEFLKEECGEIRENTVQKLKIEEYKF